MLVKKKIVRNILCFVLIIAALTGIFYSSEHVPSPSSDLKKVLAKTSSHVAIEKARVNHIAPEASKLRITHAINNNQNATSSEKQSLPEKNNLSVDEQNLQLVLASHKAESFDKWLTVHNQQSPDFDLSKEMQHRFESESINYQWAATQENLISDLFVTNSDLSGIALKDAKCRSSQCQISVAIMDIEQANNVAGKVASSLGKNNVSIIAIPDMQRGTAIFYVTQDDKDFEMD